MFNHWDRLQESSPPEANAPSPRVILSRQDGAHFCELMNGSCRYAFLIAFLMTSLSPAQNYSAERLTVDSVEIVRLRDVARDIQVSIAPSLGNNAYEMKVRGEEHSLVSLRQSRRTQSETGSGRQPVSRTVGQPHRSGGILGQRQEIPSQPSSRELPSRSKKTADSRTAGICGLECG